jgi:hypothetical protein
MRVTLLRGAHPESLGRGHPFLKFPRNPALWTCTSDTGWHALKLDY